jgi:hypothetical protein
VDCDEVSGLIGQSEFVRRELSDRPVVLEKAEWKLVPKEKERHEVIVKFRSGEDRWGDKDFIVATGITVPSPDPAVLADPTTVSAGPKDTPELGDRHIITKPW